MPWMRNPFPVFPGLMLATLLFCQAASPAAVAREETNILLVNEGGPLLPEKLIKRVKKDLGRALKGTFVAPGFDTPYTYYVWAQESARYQSSGDDPGYRWGTQVWIMDSYGQIIGSGASVEQMGQNSAHKYGIKFAIEDMKKKLKAGLEIPAARCILCDYASLTNEQLGKVYVQAVNIVNATGKKVSTDGVTDERGFIEVFLAADQMRALDYILQKPTDQIEVRPGSRRDHLVNLGIKKKVPADMLDKFVALSARTNFDEAIIGGATPLLQAVAEKDYTAARLLLERGANPNRMAHVKVKGGEMQVRSPLGIAAQSDRDMVQLLLSYGADQNAVVDSWYGFPWVLALMEGQADIAAMLEPDIATVASHPNSRTELVKLADNAARYAQADMLGRIFASTPLDTPDDLGRLLLMTVLGLTQYIDVETKRPKDTAKATYQDYGALAGTLIAAGANINFANPETGDTPLSWTVQHGFIDVAVELLNRGANIRGVTIDGQDLLSYAIEKKQPKLMHFLLARGADANARDSQGVPAFHKAVDTYDTQMIAAFIDAAVDMNIADLRGNTALHAAYPAGQFELSDLHYKVIAQLINAGLDPAIPNFAGLTADAAYQQARNTYLQQEHEKELARIERRRLDDEARQRELAAERKREERRRQAAMASANVQRYQEPDVFGAVMQGLVTSLHQGAQEIAQMKREFAAENQRQAALAQRAQEYQQWQRQATEDKRRGEQEVMDSYNRNMKAATDKAYADRLKAEQEAEQRRQKIAQSRQMTITGSINLPNTQVVTDTGTPAPRPRNEEQKFATGCLKAAQPGIIRFPADRQGCEDHTTVAQGSTAGGGYGNSGSGGNGNGTGNGGGGTGSGGYSSGGGYGAGSGGGNGGSGSGSGTGGSGGTGGDDKAEKYVWFSGVEGKTSWGLPEDTREAAVEWIEKYDGPNKAGRYCRDKWGSDPTIIVTEVTNVQYKEVPNGKDTQYHAKAEVRGYCKFSRYSRAYDGIPWCAVERRGQPNCALHGPD